MQKREKQEGCFTSEYYLILWSRFDEYTQGSQALIMNGSVYVKNYGLMSLDSIVDVLLKAEHIHKIDLQIFSE